ncbi:hypothetical protein BJX61DRAFT_151774 [Aspergillus egyptiacus]|nr:hypothetical protein BJX61DRAFT_151774 [Aspergillus egyptiacus]
MYHGFRIPKGTTVVATHFALDTDESVFKRPCALTRIDGFRILISPSAPLDSVDEPVLACMSRRIRCRLQLPGFFGHLTLAMLTRVAKGWRSTLGSNRRNGCAASAIQGLLQLERG